MYLGPVGRKRACKNPAKVLLERAQLLRRDGVPQTRGVVRARRRQQRAVRVPPHTRNRRRVLVVLDPPQLLLFVVGWRKKSELFIK